VALSTSSSPLITSGTLARREWIAFPDTNHTINEVLSDADRVVVRLTMHATHRGEYQGISPTNRRIEFTAIVIYRIDGGKIAETWGEVDFARLIRQLRA
jgi:predicted ester cyclase